MQRSHVQSTAPFVNDTKIGGFLPQREWPHMPRDGAIIFSDLIGKLEVLRVTCAKCERDGRYILARLIQRGRDAKVIDWLDEITKDCPTKSPAT